MVLSMQDNLTIVFHKEGIQMLVLFQFWQMIENENVLFLIQHDMG